MTRVTYRLHKNIKKQVQGELTMKKLLTLIIVVVTMTGCSVKKESSNISEPVDATNTDVQSNDVSTISEPKSAIFLPDEYKRSEYDDKYFVPDTDDYFVITYTISFLIMVTK